MFVNLIVFLCACARIMFVICRTTYNCGYKLNRRRMYVGQLI